MSKRPTFRIVARARAERDGKRRPWTAEILRLLRDEVRWDQAIEFAPPTGVAIASARRALYQAVNRKRLAVRIARKGERLYLWRESPASKAFSGMKWGLVKLETVPDSPMRRL